MPLESRHFTQPNRNARLEQCLVSDPAHVTPGSRGDHVTLIQQALNKLRALPGGEDFRLTVDGHYSAETSAAVLEFKTRRDIIARQRQTRADNVVGKMTIARLDDEMSRLERLAAATIKVDVTPMQGHLVADCDMNGFSRNRLTRPGSSGDWTTSSSKIPVHQMIPAGMTRKLRFSYSSAGAFSVLTRDPTIASVVEHRREADREGRQRHLVTLKGHRAGTTDLAYLIDGIAQGAVRLPVRSRQLVHLNAVYLGPRSMTADAAGFARDVFGWLNLFVTPQTNILFVPITVRVEPTISLRGGPRYDIDPKKPLYILDDTEIPPADAQGVTWSYLERFHTTNGVTLFYGRNLRVFKESVGGQNLTGTRMCWASLTSKLGQPIRALIIKTAHEVLHALGADHIKTGENQHFIMNPAPTPKSYVIPSETLIDI